MIQQRNGEYISKIKHQGIEFIVAARMIGQKTEDKQTEKQCQKRLCVIDVVFVFVVEAKKDKKKEKNKGGIENNERRISIIGLAYFTHYIRFCFYFVLLYNKRTI